MLEQAVLRGIEWAATILKEMNHWLRGRGAHQQAHINNDPKYEAKHVEHKKGVGFDDAVKRRLASEDWQRARHRASLSGHHVGNAASTLIREGYVEEARVGKSTSILKVS